MHSLKRLETELLDKICEKLIDVKELEKDVYQILGRRLNQEEAVEIRSKSLSK